MPDPSHHTADSEHAIVLDLRVWSVALIVLVGLALRLALVAYYTPRHSWSGDPGHYLAEGRLLAETGTYGEDPRRNHMPGMPGLVALGCFLAEKGCRYVPLILFALAGTAAAAGLWLMILPFLRPAARLPALALAQLAIPELLMTVFRLLPDLPALALTVAAILALDKASRSKPLRFAAAAGVAGGGALYLRPDYAPVLGVLAAVFFLAARQRMATSRAALAALLVPAVAVLTLLPWGLRNHQVYGELVIVPDTGSRALHWGFNDRRQLDWVKPPNPRIDDAPIERRGEVARQEALGWIAAHPGDAAFLIVSRAVSHIAPAAPGMVRSAANQIEPRPLRWLYRGTIEVVNEAWIVLGVLALATAGATLPLALRLLAAFAATRIVFPGLLFPDQGRYGLIAVPFLACVALWHFGGAGERPSRDLPRRAWIALAVVLVVQAAFLLRWGWTR